MIWIVSSSLLVVLVIEVWLACERAPILTDEQHPRGEGN